jgi:hypothetical protein
MMNTWNSSRARLAGGFFWIVRAFVLAWLFLSVVILPFSLSGKLKGLGTLKPGADSGFAFYGWTPEQLQSVMSEMRIQPEVVTGAMLVSSLVCLACFWGVGGLLFWHKSRTWVGLLASFILFMTGPGFSNLLLTQAEIPLWSKNLISLAAFFVWPTFFVMLYLFPNGSFVPHFTRYLAAFPYLLFFISTFVLPTAEGVFEWLLLLFAVGGLASQVYRYRKISTPADRQQTKWILFALGVFVGILVQAQITPFLLPALSTKSPAGFLNEWIGYGIVGILIPALIPLSIGISILRYRLWDIDVIIRRTLVWSVLTGLLGLVFFGGVTLLQALFSAVSGQRSAVAIVISTLLIAALFNPLRQRVQAFVDRRFYRRKYNAEQALASFAALAREEVDLEEISERMLAVVEETVQPEHASLWLRPTKDQRLTTPSNGWKK